MKYTEEALEAAVDAGELSEDQALKMLQTGPARAPANSKNINKTFEQFKDGKIAEDVFYTAVLKYITTVLRSKANDDVAFSNIEDAISASALKVWKSLDKFNPERGSFARYVSVIVSSEIANIITPPDHLPLEKAEELTDNRLSPEKKSLFRDWLQKLEPQTRDMVEMSMDGLTTREIGELLGVSAMTVSRTLKKIKDVTKSPF